MLGQPAQSRNDDLNALGRDEGTLPRNGSSVCCHTAPATNENLSIVEVASEDPFRSSPWGWFVLRNVRLGGLRRMKRGHLPRHARAQVGHPMNARGQGT